MHQVELLLASSSKSMHGNEQLCTDEHACKLSRVCQHHSLRAVEARLLGPSQMQPSMCSAMARWQQ